MSESRIAEKIAFIGGGQMAEALIAGLVSTRCCAPDQIWATDPVAARCDTLKRLYGVRVGGTNQEAAAWAGIIVLAVKPQILDGVMKELAGELKCALTVSVVAGIPIQTITSAGGTGTRVVRAMPNTPAMVREGMTALAIGPGVSEGDAGLARRMFESVGKVVAVEERLMDAVTDPRIEQITVMKSARVGYTKIINHTIAFHVHQDPCPIMVVQPTIEDAQGYSKEEIAPMIRDTPVLRDLVSDAKAKDGNNTILQKSFPGGTLSLVGANSPRGFRRVSRRIVAFDEVDGYPASEIGRAHV